MYGDRDDFTGDLTTDLRNLTWGRDVNQPPPDPVHHRPGTTAALVADCEYLLRTTRRHNEFAVDVCRRFRRWGLLSAKQEDHLRLWYDRNRQELEPRLQLLREALFRRRQHTADRRGQRIRQLAAVFHVPWRAADAALQGQPWQDKVTAWPHEVPADELTCVLCGDVPGLSVDPYDCPCGMPLQGTDDEEEIGRQAGLACLEDGP